MTSSYLAGDTLDALDVQLRLMPLIQALFIEVSPIPCKAAMEMMGLCEGELRLPLVPLSNTAREKLEHALASVGVN